jgi:hypothetical protein
LSSGIIVAGFFRKRGPKIRGVCAAREINGTRWFLFRPAVAGLWECARVRASLFENRPLQSKSDARTHRTPKALRAKARQWPVLFRPALAGLWECARVRASLFEKSPASKQKRCEDASHSNSTPCENFSRAGAFIHTLLTNHPRQRNPRASAPVWDAVWAMALIAAWGSVLA